MVLEKGIIEGRKTYANMIKYIKMTASSNFGNMFSVLASSALLPFLPMLSIHLILLNLIYDLSCTAIPWDNVDKEFLSIPRKWDATSIGNFMIWIGPTSSIFDFLTYIFMYSVQYLHLMEFYIMIWQIIIVENNSLILNLCILQCFKQVGLWNLCGVKP